MAYLDSEVDDFDPNRAEGEIDLYFFRLDASKVPGGVVAFALLALFYLYDLLLGGMPDWAVSSQAIGEGRVWTLLAHMAAHGGDGHLGLNVAVLLIVSRILMRRFGFGGRGLLAYAALLILSGLAGALLFLALNPHGTTPLLGASGAIFGLMGVAERIDRKSGALIPLVPLQAVRAPIAFALWNLLFLIASYLLVSILGETGGVAWEAHLGGFAVGLLGAPFFLDWARGAPVYEVRPPNASGRL